MLSNALVIALSALGVSLWVWRHRPTPSAPGAAPAPSAQQITDATARACGGYGTVRTAMFAMSLIGPQILELPAGTGYGLGQSMVNTGLWLAPGGLAMMLAAPIAARIAGRRGPRFTLFIGCAIICASYLAGLWLIGSAPRMLMFNVMVGVGVGVGVGVAFASMPALINAAVPISETAAANGINSLARSLGTSISSAVMAAILAGLTMSFAGGELPTLTAFRIALLVAAGAPGVGVVFALLIPSADSAPVTGERLLPASPLERSTYLVCDRIDAEGALSLGDIARELQIDVPADGRHVTELLRDGLALGTNTRNDSLSFRLTPRGRDRLHEERAAVAA